MCSERPHGEGHMKRFASKCPLVIAAVVSISSSIADAQIGTTTSELQIPSQLRDACPEDGSGKCVTPYDSLDARMPGDCEMGTISCNVGSLTCAIPRSEIVPVVRSSLEGFLTESHLTPKVDDASDTTILIIVPTKAQSANFDAYYRIRASFEGVPESPMGLNESNCRVYLTSKKVELPRSAYANVTSWKVSDDTVTSALVEHVWADLSNFTKSEYFRRRSGVSACEPQVLSTRCH